jgi:hypothetical protein
VHALAVTVSNAPGSCSRAADACLGRRGLTEVQLALIDTKAIGAGVYELVAPDPSHPPPLGKFVGTLTRTDASCQPASPEAVPRPGPGSSVTVASVGADRVTGSFELLLSDGSRLSGAFSATECAALLPASGFCAPPTAPSCDGTRTCQ